MKKVDCVESKLDQKVWNRVSQINLNPIRDRFIFKHKWAKERIEKALEDYRKFLYFCVMFPGGHLEPTNDVDQIWHDHILHMKKYESDCHLLCGRTIYHNPFPASKDAGAKLSDALGQGVVLADCDDTESPVNPACEIDTNCQEAPDCAKGNNKNVIQGGKISFPAICQEVFGIIPV